MSTSEFDNGATQTDRFRANIASSWTRELGRFSNDRRVTITARPEYVLKAHYQGTAYMHYATEFEYVTVDNDDHRLIETD